MFKPMRLLLLCLVCSAAQAAPLTLAQPFFELIKHDIAEPLELSDIDVAVLSTKGQCHLKTRRFLGMDLPDGNYTQFETWLCMSYKLAAANAAQEVTFYPIEIQKRPVEPASVADTVADIAGRAGTRRYVALVDWQVDKLDVPASCGMFCLVRMNVPMEIVLFDRKAGKAIWQAHHLNKSSYSGLKYDEKEAYQAGAGNVVAALKNLVAAEQTRRAAQAAGMTPVAVLLPGGTAELDPAVDLVLINNYRTGARHADSLDDRPTTFSLKPVGTDAKPVSFAPSYHGYFALKMAPGQYQLTIGKEERAISIAAGGKPLHIAQSRSLFLNGTNIEEPEASALLAMLGDGVNSAVPENTPGSWQSKKRVLRWVP